MKTSRIGIHLLSVFLLVLWGAVLLYFYASGRLVHYLPGDGIFRPMVLVSGIGLLVLALFNLATIGAREEDCCDHDHGHDHDHDKDDGHHHHEGCGHDHAAHDHAACSHEKEHKHEHGDCCGHDHHHEEKPKATCCGHDHSHDHDHSHGHDHSHDHAGHAHGILNESGALGRLVAILILAVPVSYAAINTPDRYSPNAVVNKGLYNPSYGKGARAEEYSLKKENRSQPMAEPTVGAPASATSAMTDGAIPPVNPKEVEKQAAKGGTETKSFGSFTMKDLEAQIARSPEGNFMLEVPELYYTAGDKEVQSVLDGQPVETIAQVLPEKVNNPDGTRVRIFKMLIQCCAADARPYSIPVEFGKAPPAMKDMAWVKVVGKITFKQENNQTVPLLEATSMTEAAAPDSKVTY